MKLNATNIRYISPSAYRVLTAVELGSRNHEVVPTSLVISLAKIHTENVHTILSGLCRDNLVAKVHGVKYDGYRLTYGGYDFLALKTLGNKDVIHSVGQQVGIGKESDIHLCATTDGEQLILKIHRLGRTSFRKIKEKRDYLKNRKTSSWLYLSRLAAMKEYAFMKVLKDNGFPVPTPVEWNRHCLVMELIDGFPLSQITEVANPGQLYSQLMNLLLRLAHAGLIHSDFNEFNLLVTPEGDPVLIDFPQMISTSHKNAKYYFDRDVECIRVFFRKRFDFEGLEWPDFDRDVGTKRNKMLDLEVEASGFSKGKQKEFEALMEGLEDDDEESDEDDEEENDSDAEKEEENAAESNDADKVNEANAPVEINLKSLSLKDEEEFDNSGPESDAESLDLPNNQLHHPHRDSRDTVKNARTTTNTKPKPVPLDKFEIKKRVAKGLKSGKKTTIKNEKGKMNGKRSAMETAKHSEAWG
ncbi:hypothetical protein HK098_000166 [Nowakowskiella sp. JEL0407]|nr:hypothetical protein HK098_000166 [Nowakowskiella sp. JEL0407]